MTHSKQIYKIPPTLFFNPNDTPSEIIEALNTLCHDYPIHQYHIDGAINLKFVAAEQTCTYLEIKYVNETAIIIHDSITGALRAVGILLSGIIGEHETYHEELPFEEFGIMIDCSRNAVIKPEHFKKWLRRICLLGFNTTILYTEDTYKLSDTPYWGYHRGCYTLEELIDLDAYAQKLGIELRACIQTLGHLGTVLKYPSFRDIRCNKDVLLIGEESSYELISKMLHFWSKAFQSKTIHLGIDEAYGFSEGWYEKINGKRDPLLVFSTFRVNPVFNITS